MKVFWKLLIGVETIILLIFTIFGCFLMYFSFQNSLEREQERSREELHFFQYALMTSMGGLPDTYQAMDLAVADIAETIQENIKNENNIVKVYNRKEQVIYETEPYESTLLDEPMKNKSGTTRIKHQNNAYYIESLAEIQYNSEKYYLEIDKNITYIYEEREQLLQNYKIAVGIAFLLSLILMSFLAAGFTKPIRRLAIETRWFADGNYKRRVAVTGHDEITELMVSFNHMADALEKNMDELAENARKQEDFTAAFAHELKTPLTSVIGYADMLRSQKLSDEDRLLSADYIFRQGKRLERLSYKLMELVGLRQGQLSVQKIQTQTLAEKVKDLTEQILQEKKISLYVNVEPGILYGDMDLLQSLLGNLIDNARKACESEGNIWLYGMQKKNGYLMFVQDNGRGIPPEEIHKISEAFYMVDKSRARKEGGAGIGMTLCKKIVELHKAEWKISSEPGIGTRVSIYFPAELEQDEEKNE